MGKSGLFFANILAVWSLTVLVILFGAFSVLSSVEGAEKKGDNLQLGDLHIGARVVDRSWSWETRVGPLSPDGVPYSGSGITSPVVWVVVAKNHYGENSGVTLLAEDLLGRYLFDNSSDRDSVYSFGSNHWGDSGSTDAQRGIRKFLNGSSYKGADENVYGITFFDSFSEGFQRSLLAVSLPCIENNAEGTPYEGNEYFATDYVFLPSEKELNGTGTYAHTEEKVWSFFKKKGDAARMATEASGKDSRYWTRTPNTNYSFSLRYVMEDGSFDDSSAASLANMWFRPALNVRADLSVNLSTEDYRLYEIIKHADDSHDDSDDDSDDKDNQKPGTVRYGFVLNKDSITVADAVVVLRYIVGLFDLDYDEKERAMVSGNDSVTVQDAILILRHIVGLLPVFPAEL